MCGIAGIISKTNSVPLKDAVFAMSQTIKHRGPDGEGFVFFSKEQFLPVYSKETPEINTKSNAFLFNPALFITEAPGNYNIVLAHRRLSIIDLSEAGHQPMCDLAGNYWITFNGEIYNYIELKEELNYKGHTFVTHTDTEVIIAAYKEWGVNCLQKFNGMFAFTLYDRQKDQLFCARDRAGVKPFYYINNSEIFAFASEQKAFVKSKLVAFRINEAQQFNFIVNANLENEEESLFAGIKELQPSHYILYDLNTHQINIRNYYSLPQNTYTELSESDIIHKIEEKLINAINLRLRSDVEVGSCLSGGLDSSIIAGVVKKLQPDKQMKLFTAVFKGETFDETGYAKEVVDFVNGNWQTVSPTADEFFRDIEQLNYYQDLPVWSTSTYSQHRVMKLASQHSIKVVLDGQGADELFGGYAHHYLALWRESSFGNKWKYINESKQTIVNPYQLYFKQGLKDVLNLSHNYSEYFTGSVKKYGKAQHVPFSSNLNEELKKDYTGKLKSFLKCEDRCSMAFGIESRVPFADDVELVDFMFSIRGDLKIQKGISKYLLREASKSYIPKAIYSRRDKVGFETPLAKWLLSNKKNIIHNIRDQIDFVNINTLNYDFDLLTLRKPGFLLRLFSFSVWKKVFSVL